jgi:hypothetical protein
VAQCAFGKLVGSRKKKIGHDNRAVQGRIVAGKPMGIEGGFD